MKISLTGDRKNEPTSSENMLLSFFISSVWIAGLAGNDVGFVDGNDVGFVDGNDVGPVDGNDVGPVDGNDVGFVDVNDVGFVDVNDVIPDPIGDLSEHILQCYRTRSLLVTVLHDDRAVKMYTLLGTRTFRHRTASRYYYST